MLRNVKIFQQYLKNIAIIYTRQFLYKYGKQNKKKSNSLIHTHQIGGLQTWREYLFQCPKIF